MNYFLDAAGFMPNRSKTRLTKDSNNVFKELNSYIKTVKSISSTNQYNNIIKKIVSLVNNKILPSRKFPIYDNEIIPISKSAPLTEKTPWGDVVLKNVDVDKNYIRKLLVVAKYGVLGFEIHKKKHEKLKILEGVCIVLYSNHAKSGWKSGKIN